MRVLAWLAALSCVVAACASPRPSGGGDCAQDGSCPDGLVCFPDWRCWAPGSHPSCAPACFGDAPICDARTLRCVACLSDADCGPGTICSSPTQRCVPGCSAAHPSCGDDGGSCDLEAGVCRGCLDDRGCAAPTPRCDPSSGTCVGCLADPDDCPPGQFCEVTSSGSACVVGCKSASECAGDGGAPSASVDCCAGKCVDTASDPTACGGCGNACRGGKVCCAGTCADLASDVDHCGACDVSCERPNVDAPTCSSSTCSDKGCEPYFGDCDHVAANGCEANLTQDPSNCFSCGHACTPYANAEPACSVTGCTLGACLAGFADCDGVKTNGCEASLNADVAHCGSCTHACASGQACVGGVCQ